MLLSPPVNVGVYPLGRYHASRLEGWCHRDTGVILACYRTDAEMTRQERSLIALSMPGAKQQRGHRLTVGPEGTARRGPSSDFMNPEGGFGAEIFFNREIYASRRGVPLRKRNIVGILLNFKVSSRSLLPGQWGGPK